MNENKIYQFIRIHGQAGFTFYFDINNELADGVLTIESKSGHLTVVSKDELLNFLYKYRDGNSTKISDDFSHLICSIDTYYDVRDTYMNDSIAKGK